MKTVVNCKTMRESDRATIEGGVRSVELVKRAASAVFEYAIERKGGFAVICGSGNNGADGYALTLMLADAGRECTAFSTGSRFTPECEHFRALCMERGLVREAIDFEPENFDNITDCLIGTGFKGSLRPDAKEIVEKINGSGKYVISVDINSGLDSDSGRADLCVRSNLTVAIQFAKAGHYLNDAKDMIGRLEVADTGIKLSGRAYRLIENGDVRALLGERKQNSHKGNYGCVALIGGCAMYSGAIKLANLGAAAIKSGCGVVKLGVPATVAPYVAPYLLESTLFQLADRGGALDYDPDGIDSLISNVKACALGMGIGRGAGVLPTLEHILSTCSLPFVIDADGLNVLASTDLSALDKTKCRVILTPHPAEFSRLTGASVDDILSDPVGVAEDFARKHNAIVLLKGCTTVITDGEKAYLSASGCAGMASGGSGDLLSGIITGMLGYLPADALTVACAAHINGLAGEIAEKKSNPISMSAGDTASSIANAISVILKK